MFFKTGHTAVAISDTQKSLMFYIKQKRVNVFWSNNFSIYSTDVITYVLQTWTNFICTDKRYAGPGYDIVSPLATDAVKFHE